MEEGATARVVEEEETARAVVTVRVVEGEASRAAAATRAHTSSKGKHRLPQPPTVICWRLVKGVRSKNLRRLRSLHICHKCTPPLLLSNLRPHC